MLVEQEEILSLRLKKWLKMRNMFAMMMNPDIKSRKTDSSTPNCSSKPPSHHVAWNRHMPMRT